MESADDKNAPTNSTIEDNTNNNNDKSHDNSYPELQNPPNQHPASNKMKTNGIQLLPPDNNKQINMRKFPFQQMIREIALGYKKDIRIKANAVKALQDACEGYLERMLTGIG